KGKRRYDEHILKSLNTSGIKDDGSHRSEHETPNNFDRVCRIQPSACAEHAEHECRRVCGSDKENRDDKNGDKREDSSERIMLEHPECRRFCLQLRELDNSVLLQG